MKYEKMTEEEIKKQFDSLPRKIVLDNVKFRDVIVELYPCGFEEQEEAGMKLEFTFDRYVAQKVFDWNHRMLNITKNGRVKLTIEIIDESVERKYKMIEDEKEE